MPKMPKLMLGQIIICYFYNYDLWWISLRRPLGDAQDGTAPVLEAQLWRSLTGTTCGTLW